MIQSEGDVARMHKGRYEHIAQSAMGKDPSTDQIIQSLRSRLDHEANHAKTSREKHGKASMELDEIKMKLKTEEYIMNQSNVTRYMNEPVRSWRKKIKYGQGWTRLNYQSKHEMEQKDKRIEFLASENDRLRDDRNEHRAYSQELYVQLVENEEYGTYEVGEEAHAEAAESSKGEANESKSRISRRKSDKVVVPPWPKSHGLDGWKSQLMANILNACADPDQEAWISWIGESFKMNPDIIKMGDSGGLRYTTIDVKLANALNAMIASSGDSGKEVGLEIKVMILDLARRDTTSR